MLDSPCKSYGAKRSRLSARLRFFRKRLSLFVVFSLLLSGCTQPRLPDETASTTESPSGEEDVPSAACSGTLSLEWNAGNTNAAGTTTYIGTDWCHEYTITHMCSGAEANASDSVSMVLSGGSNGTFYSDSKCTTSTATANIASGASRTTVYYKTNANESATLTAAAINYTPASLSGTSYLKTMDQLDFSTSLCRLQSDGVVTCSTQNGPLGHSATGLAVMAPVSGLESGGASKMWGGLRTACVVYDEDVYCWGLNNLGAYNDGTTTSSFSAITKAIELGSDNVANASLTTRVGCFIIDGALQCAGANSQGELGKGDQLSTSTPYEVFSSGATRVVTNGNTVCAIRGGDLYCWGYNQYGAAGIDPGTTSPVLTPNQVNIGSKTASDVVVGSLASCALTTDGSVYCWGDTDYDQLGVDHDGSFQSSRQVFSSGATAIAGDGQSFCAIVNGALHCWGRDNRGQCGNGAATGNCLSSNQVFSSGVREVKSAGDGYCALVGDALHCWGYDTSIYDRFSSSGSNQTSPLEIYPDGVVDFWLSDTVLCADRNMTLYCRGESRAMGSFDPALRTIDSMREIGLYQDSGTADGLIFYLDVAGFIDNPIEQSDCWPMRVTLTTVQGAGATYVGSPTGHTINLSTPTGTGSFFSNSVCTASTTSVNLPSGTSEATVYFERPTEGTSTMRATDNADSGMTYVTNAITFEEDA